MFEAIIKHLKKRFFDKPNLEIQMELSQQLETIIQQDICYPIAQILKTFKSVMNRQNI